eukprot:8567233-Prorocentrum_lima.AAC.1
MIKQRILRRNNDREVERGRHSSSSRTRGGAGVAARPHADAEWFLGVHADTIPGLRGFLEDG